MAKVRSRVKILAVANILFTCRINDRVIFISIYTPFKDPSSVLLKLNGY